MDRIWRAEDQVGLQPISVSPRMLVQCSRREGANYAMIMLNRQAQGWPRTVDEAVDRILAKLTDAEKDVVRRTPKSDLHMLHFGLGAGVRNACGLWVGNADLLASCGSPDMHPDSACAVIVQAVWERLRSAG